MIGLGSTQQYSQASSLLNSSESVSESVSEWVTDKHNQWLDSGPIKNNIRFFIIAYNANDSSQNDIIFIKNLSLTACESQSTFELSPNDLECLLAIKINSQVILIYHMKEIDQS